MTEYLLIPFDQQDEIKIDYPIKWDTSKKLWYIFDTLTPYYSKKNDEPRNGLPQVLEQYRIH
jgi:hypothetical protein